MSAREVRRVAHVSFARRDPVRPVLGFVWDALRAVGQADVALAVEPIVLVPFPSLRNVGRRLHSGTPVALWPKDAEARLRKLHPLPTLVHYLPVPARSIESATLALATHLARRSIAARPELLHGSFLDEGGFAATAAARVLEIPSIVVAHGSDVRATRGELDDRGRERRARATLACATRVLAASKYLASALASVGANAEVVRYTTPKSRFPLAPPPRPDAAKVVQFVGNVSRDKGVDLLLAAFSSLRDTSVSLRIVGPSVPGFDASAEARKLGIADRVEILGARPEHTLAELYASASLTVLPSRHEGYGIVLVESLLVGRPVVGTKVGGIPEIITPEVGMLVEPDNVHALAHAIETVLAEAARGAYPPARLRAEAEPLAWESSGPRLAQITQETLRVPTRERGFDFPRFTRGPSSRARAR